MGLSTGMGRIVKGTHIVSVWLLMSLFLLSACATLQEHLPFIPGGAEASRVNVASLSPGGIQEEKLISPDFQLGPEDVLEIIVWRNETLSKTVTVRPDGKISLPLIGEVPAAGFTAAQVRSAIVDRLKEYKEIPEVAVVVKEIHSFSVYVVGEVIRPGRIELKGETTLLQAITMSGGFTRFARIKKIVLLRREGGYETRTPVNYKEIISGKDPDGNVILSRGDTIVVP